MQGDTADRILQTTNALLVERGYSAFSYADVAEAVKIRKASIHHHFPTKTTLVVAVLRAHRANLRRGMEALDQNVSSPMLRLRQYFAFWEGCIADKTMSFCIGALLSAELPSLPEEVQAEVKQHFAVLTEWFEATLKAGSDAGELQLQHAAATEAQVLIASLHGAMLSARAMDSCDVFKLVSQAALQRLSPADGPGFTN